MEVGVWHKELKSLTPAHVDPRQKKTRNTKTVRLMTKASVALNMVALVNRGPQYKPENTIVLNMGDP